MRHRAIAVGVLGIALLALVYLASRRGPTPAPQTLVEPSDNAHAQTPSVAADTTTLAAGGLPAAERAASELRGMSQSFRNGSFLIAIRRAGFFCEDVVSAVETTNGTWVASCADLLGYKVGVLGGDRFDVHPITHYFDGITPVPINRDAPLEPPSSNRFR